MAALEAGVLAPDFTLPTVDGKEISLKEALSKGPLVLLFFKVTCPVCQYAAPFLERLYRAHRGEGVTFLGISQHDVHDTRKFMKEHGVTFPVALDDRSGYPVSNAYGITNVPTVFYISPNGEIEVSSVSWSKADMEAIHGKLTEADRQPLAPLWRKGEKVADFRAG